jgi:hypothetical protein
MLLLARPTAQERRPSLPGDGLVSNPAAEVMHAVTVRAPPQCVWPWLAQMGAGRAGWYSYDWIDNGGKPSATEVTLELQPIAVGDIMPALPGAQDAFVVAAVERERDLPLDGPGGRGRRFGQLGVLSRAARQGRPALDSRACRRALAGGRSRGCRRACSGQSSAFTLFLPSCRAG